MYVQPLNRFIMERLADGIRQFNTPTSVTYSAIIYCLRAMVNMEVGRLRRP
jgi:hypothetical protein